MSLCFLQPPAEGRTSPIKSLQNGSPSKCPRFIKIKNWETGTIYSDTLHHSSSKVRQLKLTWRVFVTENHPSKGEKDLDDSIM